MTVKNTFFDDLDALPEPPRSIYFREGILDFNDTNNRSIEAPILQVSVQASTTGVPLSLSERSQDNRLSATLCRLSPSPSKLQTSGGPNSVIPSNARPCITPTTTTCLDVDRKRFGQVTLPQCGCIRPCGLKLRTNFPITPKSTSRDGNYPNRQPTDIFSRQALNDDLDVLSNNSYTPSTHAINGSDALSGDTGSEK